MFVAIVHTRCGVKRALKSAAQGVWYLASVIESSLSPSYGSRKDCVGAAVAGGRRHQEAPLCAHRHAADEGEHQDPVEQPGACKATQHTRRKPAQGNKLEEKYLKDRYHTQTASDSRHGGGGEKINSK